MFKLRSYQEEAINCGVEVMLSSQPSKELLVLPTGAGKSIIIAEIAKRLNGNILVVQPSKELLSQNLSKFQTIGGKASVFSASFNSKEIGKITYATIGSLNVESFIRANIKYVIQDEAHLHTQKGSKLSLFLKGIGVKNLLGLTATPLYLKSTMNGAQLKIMTRVKGKLYNKISHVTQIKELVENKFWSKLEYELIDVDNSSLMFNTTGSDYTLKSMIINYTENGIANKITEKVKTLKDRKSILIFVPTIEDAEDLSRRIEGSKVVHSKISAKERDLIINSFKELRHRVTINVNVLSVGFDHPQLDCVITARPTASIAMYYQQLGRGCRIHADKEFCQIIDYSGNVSKFGALEDLNFEDVKGYGWGLFNKDVLLSAVPMYEGSTTTKQTLLSKTSKPATREQLTVFPTVLPNSKLKFWFGKHKGKSANELVSEGESQYLKWLLSNKDFKWIGDNYIALKKSIVSSLETRPVEFKVKRVEARDTISLSELYSTYIDK